MKRHAVALVLQPYKNRLMPAHEVRGSIDRFAEEILSLRSTHPNIHFSVALPGYILECLNPLLLSRLREHQKQGCLEWLLTGQTEPFLSFFPAPQVQENIRDGLKTFLERTGVAPVGFLPAFSNWEPSVIASLASLGLQYTALSSAVLPPEERSRCGYWITEHAGDSIALLPLQVLHHYSAPADPIDWLEKHLSRDEANMHGEKFVAVHYLLPLAPGDQSDPYRWLRTMVAELDRRILLYHPLLLQEARSLEPPLGLQHLLPCLALHDGGEPHRFMNRLRSFDQVGVLQRKMMELSEAVSALSDRRLAEQLKTRLYSLQDINRYLPARDYGFQNLEDRLWSYGRLIEIERTLRTHEGMTGGRIRISDFLRNGTKSVIMSNGSLKAYIDYRNGGHLYELDYRERDINLGAALNPVPRLPPDILSAEHSYTSFIDRIYPQNISSADIIGGIARDLGDFAGKPFEYKVKKAAESVKTVLSRQGHFHHADKSFPLNVEKVFSLEKDDALFTFVYQLTNLALAPVAFTFATELHFSIPGAVAAEARLVCNKQAYPGLGREFVHLPGVSRWHIEDQQAGFRLLFAVQKPLDLFCLPLLGTDRIPDPSCGIRLMLTVPISLEQSSIWKFMGSIHCKRIKALQGTYDAL